MILTHVENTPTEETKLRLIDRKDWYRLIKLRGSLVQLTYIDFCTVPLSTKEVMARLRREGYYDLGEIDGIVYIIIQTHDGYDEAICHHLAEDFFGIDARIEPHAPEEKLA
jgi:hypothetical protein